MIILCVRTDRPEAELALFDSEKSKNNPIHTENWQAHRELAETIHHKIDELLKRSGLVVGDLNGIVAYQGPGSFTGLRIGLSLVNALGDGLQIPVVAVQTESWKEQGVERLLKGDSDKVALPEYGAPVRITQQKR